MYKLIIVEDEKWEREGLSEYIDWTSLGIRFMGAAASGMEGLRLAQAVSPDIILSDIRMPVMDGLEFAGQVKRLFPACMILFITGYEDFSYAREAIHQGASDYLLKPVQKDQLVEAIRRMQRILDAGRQKTESTRRLRSQIQESRLAEREHWLERILAGQTEREADSVRWQGMLFANNEAMVVLIRHSGPHQDAGRPNLTQEDVRLACYQAVRDFFSENSIVIPGIDGGNEIIACLPAFPDRSETIMRLRDRVHSFFQERGTGDFIMGVGGSARSWADIPRSLLQAEKAADLAFFREGKGCNVLEYSSTSEGNEEADIQTFFTKSSGMTKDLLRSIMAPDPTNAKESGTQLLVLMEACHLDRQQVLGFFQGIMGELYTFAAGILSLPSSGNRFPDIQALRRFVRFHALGEWFAGSIEQLCRQMALEKKNRDSHLIELVVGMMHAEYATGMDLNTVSNRMGISTNRLGFLFFQQTGTHFSEALTQCRMTKAEDLLARTEGTLFDIAGKVGFSSAAYFCTVFRKHHGISPSEYRRRSREGAHDNEM